MSSNGIIQYIVLRGDLIKELGWPTGALIAQACHAVSAVTHLYHDDNHMSLYLADLDNMHKVVLETSSESDLINLNKKLLENQIKHKLWIEQPENIATCLVTKPYPKKEIQKYFNKLKLFNARNVFLILKNNLVQSTPPLLRFKIGASLWLQYASAQPEVSPPYNARPVVMLTDNWSHLHFVP
ncbi:hypothetical protein FQA39_LY02291 [Lamprigera yunnana]|nr:hypothetical protein FQA39_LY02291 [Lamprigera yunnana]